MKHLDRYLRGLLAGSLSISAMDTFRRGDAWLGCNLLAAALFIVFARDLFRDAVPSEPPASPDRLALPAMPSTHDGAFGAGAVATRKGR